MAATVIGSMLEEFIRRGGPGLTWADPHERRSPEEDEYSRVTDPAKWRVVAVRAEAWWTAIVELGLARLEQVDRGSIIWRKEPPVALDRLHRLVPRAVDARPVLVGTTTVAGAGAGDVGTLLGVGVPAEVVGVVPVCGCDACDAGSASELAQVDRLLPSVLDGSLRVLRRGGSQIVVDAEGWSAIDEHGGAVDVDAVLADPEGWTDDGGAPWTTSDRLGDRAQLEEVSTR